MDKVFNIAFIGTSAISIEFFEHFRINSSFKIRFIMTKYDDINKKGRDNLYTFLMSRKYDIPIYTPSRMKEVDENIFNDLDCVILIAYGHMIPQRMLDRAVWINMHASLLPDLRGAAPIQFAIMQNYDQTGLTATIMTSKLDAGPIIDQMVLSINPDDTFETLSKNMSTHGAPWFIQTIKKFLNKEIVPYPQNDAFATFAPSITAEHRMIEWSSSAIEIHNKVRALHPDPCAIANINNDIIKLVSTTIYKYKDEHEVLPGTLIDKRRLIVKCGSGLLEVLRLVPQSGKVMTGEQFMCGLNGKSR